MNSPTRKQKLNNVRSICKPVRTVTQPSVHQGGEQTPPPPGYILVVGGTAGLSLSRSLALNCLSEALLLCSREVVKSGCLVL